METILKIPLYLSVESGGVDRNKVTKLMQEMILPQMANGFAAFGNEHFTLSLEEKMTIQRTIGPCNFKILTVLEAMKGGL
jgi:hypothetical protein